MRLGVVKQCNRGTVAALFERIENYMDGFGMERCLRNALVDSALALTFFALLNLLTLSPVFGQYDFKTWSDNSGTFSVEARLLKINKSSVTLRKSNRVIISVPFSRLSKTDLNFVRSEFAKKNPNYTSPKFTNRQQIATKPSAPDPKNLAPFPPRLELQYSKDSQEYFPHAPPVESMPTNRLARDRIQRSTDKQPIRLSNEVPRKDDMTMPGNQTSDAVEAVSSYQAAKAQAKLELPRVDPELAIDVLQDPANTQSLRETSSEDSEIPLLSTPDDIIVVVDSNRTENTLRNPRAELTSNGLRKNPTSANSSNRIPLEYGPRSNPNPLDSEVSFAQPATEADSNSFRPPTDFKSSESAQLAGPDSNDFVGTTSPNQSNSNPFAFDASDSDAADVFAPPPMLGMRQTSSKLESNLNFEISVQSLNRLPIALRGLASNLTNSTKRSEVYSALKAIDNNWPNKHSPVLVSLTRKCVGSSNPETRKLAIQMLAEHDTAQSASYIVKGIEDADFNVRRATYALIENYDARPLLPSLTKRLDSEDRSHVASILESIGPDSESQLIPMVAHPSTDVQLTACGILGKVGTSKSISTLQSVIAKSDDSKVRMQATNAIKRIQSRQNTLR